MVTLCTQYSLNFCLNLACLQAEARERERLKEEARRLKKLEASFKSLLKAFSVDYTSNWDDVRAKLEGEPAFEAITLESERVRIFKVDAENIKCKL